MAHLHCQMTQHSYFPFTIKLFCRSTNMETISVCSSLPPSQRNNSAVRQTEIGLDGVQRDPTA